MFNGSILETLRSRKKKNFNEKMPKIKQPETYIEYSLMLMLEVISLMIGW